MTKGVVKATFFDQSGLIVGSSIQSKLPDYLDRLDIRTKAYWFMCRGYGHPDALFGTAGFAGAAIPDPGNRRTPEQPQIH